MESWQKIWNNDRKGREYNKIIKSVRVKKNISKYRKEYVAFSRLRLGHMRLNSTLIIMKKTLTDKYEVWKCKETRTQGYVGNPGSMNRGQHTTVWVEPLRDELLEDRNSN